jgi:hypothetical protein
MCLPIPLGDTLHDLGLHVLLHSSRGGGSRGFLKCVCFPSYIRLESSLLLSGNLRHVTAGNYGSARARAQAAGSLQERCNPLLFSLNYSSIRKTMANAHGLQPVTPAALF